MFKGLIVEGLIVTGPECAGPDCAGLDCAGLDCAGLDSVGPYCAGPDRTCTVNCILFFCEKIRGRPSAIVLGGKLLIWQQKMQLTA